MTLLLVQMVLDRTTRDNVVLPGSNTPAPPAMYAILEGEEGVERTKGGDMEPCRLCSVLWPEDDRVLTGL